jgi:single-strand DNA-binding protein
MAIDNTMFVVGNITGAPDLGFGSKGTAYTRFSVAQNQRVRNDEGKWEDGATTFVRCVAFNEYAENIAQLDKGTRVIVIGRMQQNDWKPEPTDEDPDPKVRTTLELIVDSCGPDLRWATATVVKNARKGPEVPPAVDPDAEASEGADEEPF